MLYQIELHPYRRCSAYFVSRCSVCCRQRGQNLLSSIRPVSLRLFLRVLYVRSLQVVHASEITGRFSALATVRCPHHSPVAAHAKEGLVTGGKCADSRLAARPMSTRPASPGGERLTRLTGRP